MPKKPRAKKKPSKKKPLQKKSRSARPRKKPLKKAPPAIPYPEIGRVIAFFRIPVVAVVKVTRGTLKVGDPIWIKGHTTDLKLSVASMQIDHQPVTDIRKGDEAGIQISGRARRGDRVYSLPA